MLAVAVEHQCWLFRCEQTGADTPLTGLAPSWVIDFRVHVRIKAILAGSCQFPARFRLFVDETHLDDALDALEPVFPWDDQPDRRAVLVRQDFPVQARMVNGLVASAMVSPSR